MSETWWFEMCIFAPLFSETELSFKFWVEEIRHQGLQFVGKISSVALGWANLLAILENWSHYIRMSALLKHKWPPGSTWGWIVTHDEIHKS